MIAEIEEEREVMGSDPWPYGISANRVTMERAVTYALEQGLIRRKFSVEELFVPGQWTNEPTAGGGSPA